MPTGRTRRSAPPPSCVWARSDDVLRGIPSGDGGWAGRWFVLCPSGRGFSDECPWERTQRSAPPPSWIWARADGVLGGVPSGTGPTRSKLVRCPSGRVFSDEGPWERTRRSAPPLSWIWSRADGVLGGTPSGMGPVRSRLVRCPSGRVFSNACPWERTQRSAPPPSWIWALADGVLGGMPSGDGGWAGSWERRRLGVAAGAGGGRAAGVSAVPPA
jgi:hypothetical protein